MSAVPGPNAPPFPFIVARGRSGTTLLRAMFDAHPAMCVPGESHFVVQFAGRRANYETGGAFDVERFGSDLFGHWAFRRWGLPDAVVRDAFALAPPPDFPAAIRSVYAAYARLQVKPRFGDKTPSYVRHIDLLADTFPEAVFIHLIRDGRDVALSYLSTDFGVSTLGQAAIQWDRYVRAGREAGGRLGLARYREVRYEELVREPERVVAELCTFVGLPFDGSMLRYHEQSQRLIPSLSHSEHHQNLQQPPTVGVRDWRREMSRADIAVFESLAGDLLDELEYERGTTSSAPGTTLRAARFRLGTEIRRVAHGSRVGIRKFRKRIARRMIDRESRSRIPQTDRIGGQP